MISDADGIQQSLSSSCPDNKITLSFSYTLQSYQLRVVWYIHTCMHGLAHKYLSPYGENRIRVGPKISFSSRAAGPGIRLSHNRGEFRLDHGIWLVLYTQKIFISITDPCGKIFARVHSNLAFEISHGI